ncbi:MAG: hypothetical protein M1586_01395 [Patescibacteria group bacterium]|nr:hypothetical protein [Patescibacteria group bacterium]MCL5261939.1 hypothetical protein [Patescibacteria group bacterium]
MELRGIDFGNVLGASGVQGFFGEGYWFHRIWSRFGLDFAGMTFVAKTATLFPREGNMPLTRLYTPYYPFPRCVKIKPLRGVMLNSIGLSNPGIGALLGVDKWQKRTKPFLLSVMSLADTPAKRLDELRLLVETIGLVKDSFHAPFGLQINLSCPNTEHDPRELIKESVEVLKIVAALGVPIMPKYSIASASMQAVLELGDHSGCDAICVSNTLPFGWQSLDWQSAWGSRMSPLAKFGGGGLSGKVLRPLVCEWIARLRDAGFTKPINGGGGIFLPEDAEHYHDAGASSIFIGSVAVLRPWRVASIIRRANDLVWV